jgi:hypothetical protein
MKVTKEVYKRKENAVKNKKHTLNTANSMESMTWWEFLKKTKKNVIGLPTS